MENERLEKAAACTLGRLFGDEPRIARGIIDALGSAAAVFRLGREELRDLAGPYGKVFSKLEGAGLGESESILSALEERGVDFIPLTDRRYPALLRECEDAPAGLYVRSSTPIEEVFDGRPAVSVVGTRDITPYGKEWCERIVLALSRASRKPVIVSGLAIGIDVTAHLAALSSGLPTVAVLPTGIDDIYPKRHTVVAGKIASSQGGALVTDFPPGTMPMAPYFLRRNRIIAGLADATILVESKVKGGGMMTARLAAGYGRTVLALPGRVDDLRSGGCNYLLREKVAEPLTDLDSMVEALGLGGRAPGRRRDPVAALRERLASEARQSPGVSSRCAVGGGSGFRSESVSPGEGDDNVELLCAALDLVSRQRGIEINRIGEDLGVGPGRAAALVTTLEAEGFIQTDLLGRCRLVWYN